MNMNSITGKIIAIVFLTATIYGCGGSSSTPSTTPLGSVDIPVTLSSEFSVHPLVNNPIGTGSGILTLNRDTGVLSGAIAITGLTEVASNAHIHVGIAGIETSGNVVIPLDFTVSIDSAISVRANTILTSDQMTALLNADYYVNVHTAGNGAGELRGQILPANFQVIRTLLDGASVTTPTGSSNTGIAFLTINTATLSVRGNITNTGLDNANAAHIHGPDAPLGTDASPIVGGTFVKDAGNLALWELPDTTVISQANMDSMLAGGTYVNVHTPTLGGFPGGEIRGQIVP